MDTDTELSWRRPTISSSGSADSTPQHRAAYATERARLMLGCYRRGEANDPDTYVAAIAAVLATFELDIIREATDPRTGIQSTEKFAAFMPNAGEVKAFCDALASRKLRLAHYRALPPPGRVTRRAPPPDPPVINDATSPHHGKHPPGTILANYDEAVRLYGRPLCAFEDGRERPYNSGRRS